MKKHHITPIIAALMIIAGIIFAKLNKDFALGVLTGSGAWLLVTVSLGKLLARKHQERIDKLTLDRLEDIASTREELANEQDD